MLTDEFEFFEVRYSYRGILKITDNTSKMHGKFDKGTSQGSIWVGPVYKPLKKFE